MHHGHEISTDQIRLGSEAGKLQIITLAMVVVGVAVSLLSLGGDDGMKTFYQSFLVNYTYVLSLSLGALFFLIITSLLRAGWNISVRRVAEVMSLPLVPLALLGGVVVMGMHDLYEWTHAEEVANDPILLHKTPYLNSNFFILRLVIYFVVWNLIAWYFRARSLKQDETGDPRITSRIERWSSIAIIAYALTVTLAAFDLMMSLYPHWYSTIFGVYYFAGCFMSFFAALICIIFVLQRYGRLKGVVNVEHFHDLGKMMFAFVVFWAYIAFSQFMLIWYANLPEETVFYDVRQEGLWTWWSLFLLVGHFFVPFLFIMSRYQKRRPIMLGAAAIWLLVLHWVDMFYLQIPGHRSADAPFRFADFGLWLAMVGLFGFVVIWRLRQVNLIPIRDPRLHEALSFENV